MVTTQQTFTIAGKEIHRLGYGALRLTGEGVWGPHSNPEECVRVLRRSVELGVDLIDTAAAYGPHFSEQIIKEALHPYPTDLLISTKVGVVRHGPQLDDWLDVGRPEYLRYEALMSMRRLGLDHIDLLHLHRVDPKVPLEDQVGALKEMKDEGLIGAVGLSEVTVDQIEQARGIVDIASVQNRFNLTTRHYQDVLEYCTEHGIGFMPWFPVAAGRLAQPGGPVARVAEPHGATAAQVSLAWLLRRSPVTLPIPGTASVAHLEENMGARDLADRLTDEDMTLLEQATSA